MPASFRIEQAGPDRLAASGDLDFATAAKALSAGLALLPAGGRCTIDLAGITSADSAGLAVLIEWLSAAAGRGATLLFDAVPEQLRAIARISDVEELIVGQSVG